MRLMSASERRAFVPLSFILTWAMSAPPRPAVYHTRTISAGVASDRVECDPVGSPRTGDHDNGERAHGSREDPRGEGKGRCAGRAPRRAGWRGEEGGAGLSHLSPAPLLEGSGPLHL